MKAKGFTLVELLAVLVILSLLFMIVIFSVGSITNKSESELSDIQIDSIKQAAQTYYLKEGMNQTDIGFNQYKSCVNVQYLVENSYIENEVIDPNDREIINGSILITYESNKYRYDYRDYNCSSSFYLNGDVVYFDVVTGKGCSEEEYKSSYDEATLDYLNSSTGYNGINKTNNLQNSCLKFYAFNDNWEDKINLLLDHNVVAMTYWNSSGNNSEGPNEVITKLKESTKEWQGTITPSNQVAQTLGREYTVKYRDEEYKARLITANEIAIITNNKNWDETSSTSASFFFDTNSSSESPVCKNGDTSGCMYGWLYDRASITCSLNGCLNNSDYETSGYWTVSSTAFLEPSFTDCNGSITFGISHRGRLGHSCPNNGNHYGVRPVIEVLKENLSN